VSLMETPSCGGVINIIYKLMYNRDKDRVCYLISLSQYEGEKNHKKGGLNCVFKNFSFLRSEKLFPDSESEIVQSLT